MTKTFIVDFDGTLVEDVYPRWGDWLPGAQDALREMLKHGRVKIFSSRINPYRFGHDGDDRQRRPALDIACDISKIRKMLAEANLLAVEIHMTEGKPSGDVYIDNLAVRFEGDWNDTLLMVLGHHFPDHRVNWSVDSENEYVYTGEVRTFPEVATADVQGDWDFSGDGPVRVFGTGATRDTDEGKLDYCGFFSPAVLTRRAQYMHRHRVQSDGTLRDSDNWKKGIPVEEYMKSLGRHYHEVWSLYEDGLIHEAEEALCAIAFNVEGILYELLKEQREYRSVLDRELMSQYTKQAA